MISMLRVMPSSTFISARGRLAERARDAQHVEVDHASMLIAQFPPRRSRKLQIRSRAGPPTTRATTPGPRDRAQWFADLLAWRDGLYEAHRPRRAAWA